MGRNQQSKESRVHVKKRTGNKQLPGRSNCVAKETREKKNGLLLWEAKVLAVGSHKALLGLTQEAILYAQKYSESKYNDAYISKCLIFSFSFFVL